MTVTATSAAVADMLPVTRVGICEDDVDVRRLLTDALKWAGHSVVLARSGGEAVSKFSPPGAVDVVVLDIGLPDSDGRDVCHALRVAGQQALVLFLSAFGATEDRVSGFHAGGDDYLCKPFAMAEVIARVSALLKRSTSAPPDPTGLHLDPRRFSLRCEDLEERLTPLEYRLLAALAVRPGSVVRRRSLVLATWADAESVSENTLDVFVRRVRVKLEAVASPRRVRTVRGDGFVLE